MDSSPVILTSRWTRTQVPILLRLLKPVVDHNVHDNLLSNKECQASNYNKGAKDLAELKSGDMVSSITPWNRTNEAVKPRVNKPMGTLSNKVITEDGAIYRQNRHLRKQWRSILASDLNLTVWLSKQAEGGAAVLVVSEKQCHQWSRHKGLLKVQWCLSNQKRGVSLSHSRDSLDQVISQWQCLSSQKWQAQGDL